jgi:Na+-driven multidrug efflux pump
MDLQHAWNKLKEEKLSMPTDQLFPPLTKHSKYPVQKLMRALLITLGCTIVFGLFFIVLIFLFEPWLIRAFLLTLSAFYVLAYVYNQITYNKLKSEWANAIEISLKNSLERIHYIVCSSIRSQEKAAIFIYPISVAPCFMMGLFQGGGGADFGEDIRNGTILTILSLLMAILTPACYYLSRWMYKVSYDTYLDQLKKLIDEMKREW